MKAMLCLSHLRCLPATLGIPWFIDASLQTLPLSSHDILLVCLSSHKDTRHWIYRWWISGRRIRLPMQEMQV